jgi:hypothetical protein
MVDCVVDDVCFAPVVPSEQDVHLFHQLFPPPHTLAPRTSGLGPSLIRGYALLKRRPGQNRPIFDVLYKWRYNLYLAYSNLEKNRIDEGRLDQSIFQYVHDEALSHLDPLLARLEKDELGSMQLVHMQFSAPGKSKKARHD